MNALIVFAHPNPMSFNASLAKVVQEELAGQGAQVKVKDLYAMGWNPVLSSDDFEGYHTGKITPDVQQEQNDVAWADLVVFIGPVWWYSVPAIMKGYVDRVFSLGFAYKYTQTGPQGLLTGKKGLLITTSGADQKTAEAGGMLDVIRKSMADGLFGFSGFSAWEYKNLFAVTTVADEERKQMLTDIRQFVKKFA